MRDDVSTPWSTSKMQGNPPNVHVAHHYPNEWLQNPHDHNTFADLPSSRELVEIRNGFPADLVYHFKPSSVFGPTTQSFESNISQPLVSSGQTRSDSHNQDNMEGQIPWPGSQNWGNSPGAQRTPTYMIEQQSFQSCSGSVVQSQRQVTFEADQYINPEIARLRKKCHKEQAKLRKKSRQSYGKIDRACFLCKLAQRKVRINLLHLHNKLITDWDPSATHHVLGTKLSSINLRISFPNQCSLVKYDQISARFLNLFSRTILSKKAHYSRISLLSCLWHLMIYSSLSYRS